MHVGKIKELYLKVKEYFFSLSENSSLNNNKSHETEWDDVSLLPMFISELCALYFKNNEPVNYIGTHPNSIKRIFDLSDPLSSLKTVEFTRKQLLSGELKNFYVFGSGFSIANKEGVSVKQFDIDKFISGEIIVVSFKPCEMCGENLVFIYLINNGQLDLVTKSFSSQCCYELKPFELNLKYNTGDEIMFGDWLGGKEIGLDLDKEKAMIGNKLKAKSYEKLNIGHFYIGDSSPNVYQKGNKIYIGEHEDIGVKINGDWTIDDNVKKLGMINTENWTATIATKTDIINGAGLEENESCEISEEHKTQFDRADFIYKAETDIIFKVKVFPFFERDNVDNYAIIEIVDIDSGSPQD